jgi:hypothetical protein
MPKLHVISGGEGAVPPCDITQAAQAALTQILSHNPRALLFIFETADGVGTISVPNLYSVTRGLIGIVSEDMFREG